MSAPQVVPLYCFDPRQFNRTPFGNPKTGAFRAKFLLESVLALRAKLRGLGSDLLIANGRPEDVLTGAERQGGLSLADGSRLSSCAYRTLARCMWCTYSRMCTTVAAKRAHFIQQGVCCGRQAQHSGGMHMLGFGLFISTSGMCVLSSAFNHVGSGVRKERWAAQACSTDER